MVVGGVLLGLVVVIGVVLVDGICGVLVAAAVVKATAGGQAAGRTGSLSPMDPRRMMKSQITTMDQVKTSSHAALRRPLETGRTTITCLS